MPQLAIVIPCFNGIRDTAPCWGALAASVLDRKNVELVVVDNGSTDETVKFLIESIAPHFPRFQLLHNKDNSGFPTACNQGLKFSSAPVVAFLHNDLIMLERGWDQRVLRAFDHPKVGLAGFCAANIAEADGGRSDVISNLYDAERHGRRFVGDHPTLLFDSLSLIGRRTFLNQVGGLDEGYGPCHFADKDLSMASLTLGWTNYFIGVFCLHLGGTTSTSEGYQLWAKSKGGDMAIFTAGKDRYLEKWGSLLPCRT